MRERERGRIYVCEKAGERVCVCVCERVGERVCVRGREGERK